MGADIARNGLLCYRQRYPCIESAVKMASISHSKGGEQLIITQFS
jgi:hypothetical protein